MEEIHSKIPIETTNTIEKLAIVNEDSKIFVALGCWARMLREGRKIVVPQESPLAPISSNPFYALSSDFTGLESALYTGGRGFYSDC